MQRERTCGNHAHEWRVPHVLVEGSGSIDADVDLLMLSVRSALLMADPFTSGTPSRTPNMASC
jgi:hypothetical protein